MKSSRDEISADIAVDMDENMMDQALAITMDVDMLEMEMDIDIEEIEESSINKKCSRDTDNATIKKGGDLADTSVASSSNGATCNNNSVSCGSVGNSLIL